MNFQVPSKKELKEKYNISNEDFDIIVSSELPKATELSHSESFVEKVASYFGIPTFLIRKKHWALLSLSFFILILNPKCRTNSKIAI